MRTLREKLDAVLFKYDIDVCRLFAVLCLCEAATSVWEMCVAANVQGFWDYDFGILLVLFMAWAFWKRKAWPRFVWLVILWIGAGMLVLLLAMTITGTIADLMPLTLRLHGIEITEFSRMFVVAVCVFSVYVGLVIAISLLLLYSAKIRDEIAVRSEPVDDASASGINKILWLIIAVDMTGVASLETAWALAMHERNNRLQTIGGVFDGTNQYFRVNGGLVVLSGTNENFYLEIKGDSHTMSVPGASMDIDESRKYIYTNNVIEIETWQGRNKHPELHPSLGKYGIYDLGAWFDECKSTNATDRTYLKPYAVFTNGVVTVPGNDAD